MFLSTLLILEYWTELICLYCLLRCIKRHDVLFAKSPPFDWRMDCGTRFSRPAINLAEFCYNPSLASSVHHPGLPAIHGSLLSSYIMTKFQRQMPYWGSALIHCHFIKLMNHMYMLKYWKLNKTMTDTANTVVVYSFKINNCWSIEVEIIVTARFVNVFFSGISLPSLCHRKKQCLSKI